MPYFQQAMDMWDGDERVADKIYNMLAEFGGEIDDLDAWRRLFVFFEYVAEGKGRVFVLNSPKFREAIIKKANDILDGYIDLIQDENPELFYSIRNVCTRIVEVLKIEQ